MKFPQLRIGERFEYQGQVYTKASPVTATDAEGRSRMIMRSAVVKPLDRQPESVKEQTISLKAGQLLKAVDEYHRQCLSMMGEDNTQEETIQALVAARDRLLKTLDIQ